MPDSAGSAAPPAGSVGDVGEHALLARIRARVPPPPAFVAVGIGDDAAVIEPAKNTLDVLTTDALVEGVHFERRLCPPRDIGFRALAVNLSDLAAMGAAPRAALLSLALPAGLPVADVDAIIDGLLEAARPHGLALIGGNITRSTGPLVIDVTAVGAVHRRRVLRRTGARPGDELYVSGTIGAAAAGLSWLKAVEAGTVASADPELEACASRYRRPEARVRLGLLVGRNRAASACVDLSDGLADAVWQLTSASGTGAIIHADRLPVDSAARRWFEARGDEPLTSVIGAGDDYELLVAVPRKARRRFLAVTGMVKNPPVTRVGVVTKELQVVLRRASGDTPLGGGYAHFSP